MPQKHYTNHCVFLMTIISILLYIHQVEDPSQRSVRSGSVEVRQRSDTVEVSDVHPLYIATHQANLDMAKQKEAEYLKELLQDKDNECVGYGEEYNLDIDWQSWLNDKQKTDKFIVPNVVHYLHMFDDTCLPHDLNFTAMLSILSVQVYVKPEKILFHTNCQPSGPLWDTVNKYLEVKKHHSIKCAFGFPFMTDSYPHLQQDIDKLGILMEHGGIFLSTDIIFVREFNHQILQFPCTLKMIDEYKASMDIIISSKHSEFVSMWLNSYFRYRVRDLPVDSGIVAATYARRYPFLVHILCGRRPVENTPNMEFHVDESFIKVESGDKDNMATELAHDVQTILQHAQTGEY